MFQKIIDLIYIGDKIILVRAKVPDNWVSFALLLF